MAQKDTFPPPRDLTIRSLDDLTAELDRIEAAIRAGTARATRRWTVGQNLDHCAIFIRYAIDGFPSLMPWWFRMGARLMMKRTAVGPGKMPAGIKLPKQADYLMPGPGVTDAQGLEHLRAQVARLRSGERMTARSPVFDRLTHEEWLSTHLKHCALHMSFISGVEG